MTLSSSQLQLLADLDIPVWVRRAGTASDRSEPRSSEQHATVSLPREARWLVLPSPDPGEEQRQLLEAMLRAIQLDLDAVAVLDAKQFTALMPELRSDTRVLLMLETLPDALAAQGMSADTPALTELDSGARIVVCHGPDSLLANAALKAHAWQSLKLFGKAL